MIYDGYKKYGSTGSCYDEFNLLLDNLSLQYKTLAGSITSLSQNIGIGGIVGVTNSTGVVRNNTVYSNNEDPEFAVVHISGRDSNNTFLKPYIGYVVGHNKNGTVENNYVDEDVVMEIGTLTLSQRTYISTSTTDHCGN